jgi:hypothetical protein
MDGGLHWWIHIRRPPDSTVTLQVAKLSGQTRTRCGGRRWVGNGSIGFGWEVDGGRSQTT